MEGIARVHADTFFLGVTGVDVRAGLSTGDAEEAGIKRALIAASAETVVLASSEKLGVASPHVVAPLAVASTLVVPAAAPKAMVAAWRKLGLDVVLAGGA
jgi:DeoR/GlpR family transcriptional regulator of sugar metabolism